MSAPHVHAFVCVTVLPLLLRHLHRICEKHVVGLSGAPRPRKTRMVTQTPERAIPVRTPGPTETVPYYYTVSGDSKLTPSNSHGFQPPSASHSHGDSICPMATPVPGLQACTKGIRPYSGFNACTPSSCNTSPYTVCHACHVNIHMVWWSRR